MSGQSVIAEYPSTPIFNTYVWHVREFLRGRIVSKTIDEAQRDVLKSLTRFLSIEPLLEMSLRPVDSVKTIQSNKLMLSFRTMYSDDTYSMTLPLKDIVYDRMAGEVDRLLSKLSLRQGVDQILMADYLDQLNENRRDDRWRRLNYTDLIYTRDIIYPNDNRRINGEFVDIVKAPAELLQIEKPKVPRPRASLIIQPRSRPQYVAAPEPINPAAQTDTNSRNITDPIVTEPPLRRGAPGNGVDR